jgi:hypothetical protein
MSHFWWWPILILQSCNQPCLAWRIPMYSYTGWWPYFTIFPISQSVLNTVNLLRHILFMFSRASCYYIVSHLSKLLHQKLRPLRRSKSFGGRGTAASIYETGKRMLIISVNEWKNSANIILTCWYTCRLKSKLDVITWLELMND